jgi:hypothetical protein
VDRLDRLGEVRALARRTRRIAMQSVLAGMGMSVAAMAVAAAGLLPCGRSVAGGAIWADIGQLRTAADALGVVPPREAMSGVRQAHQLLVDEVGPHERAEQEQLYPMMNRLLGSSHATAAMSRTYAEIAHQTRRLGQLIDDIGAAQPDAADIADLRALLYGLHAILSLHTAQEDESYISLGDGARRVGSLV